MVKIDREGQNMMEALGISQERCEELCTAIEETWQEHHDWNFGQVLAHCKEHHTKEDNRDNEVAFMVYVFGRHSGIVDGIQAGQKAAHIAGLFERVFGGQTQHSYAFGEN